MMRTLLLLIIPVAILFSFGLLMIFNTTAAQIIDRSLTTDTHAAILKQFCYGIAGLCIGFGMYTLGYQNFIRYSPVLLALGVVLLFSVFIPGVGQSVNGARRWISLFGFSFQPSEWIKILIPATYIQWCLRQKSAELDLKRFLQILALLSIPLGLILMEPDNGTTAIILSVLLILFILTKVAIRYWALPLCILFSMGAAIAYQMPHVHDRIWIYLHPELDLKGKGHQPYQAKIAAGSGGLLGRGLGESLQKLDYLPEARNDYIAAIFAEEMGFVGILGLVALYMTFSYAGFSIALGAKDREGFLLGSTLAFLVAIQAFLNLGIVSGLLPSKGMTLPFFSQGGTSLIVNLAIVFLFLDIGRKSMRGVSNHAG